MPDPQMTKDDEERLMHLRASGRDLSALELALHDARALPEALARIKELEDAAQAGTTDLLVDARDLLARAEKAEAKLRAIDAFTDRPGVSFGPEAIKQLRSLNRARSKR